MSSVENVTLTMLTLAVRAHVFAKATRFSELFTLLAEDKVTKHYKTDSYVPKV